MTASLRLQLGLDDEPWREKALCQEIGGDEWFPEKGGSTREAKKICLACEVSDKCLAYALKHDERHGIWGGYSERERRRLQRGEVFTPSSGDHTSRGHGSAA